MKYSNPVIPGFHPDPSICRAGDDYYLSTSTFEYFPGVPVFHSRDLVNWTMIGHCLTKESQLDLKEIPSSGGIFAPTLRYHKGFFYMTTTVVGGKGHIIVKTEDPAGSWSEPVYVEGSGFDPDLFFDDGKVYFTREDIRGHGIRQWEIDIDTGRLIGEEKLIFDGYEDRLCEAPHIYKKDGYYYLLTAEGGTYRGHMITVSRSRRPEGPYEMCPRNPILTHRHHVLDAVQSVGHGDLIEAHDGTWWIVFLGTRPKGKWHVLGRETFLAPVEWDDEGWPVINRGEKIELEGNEAPSFCSGQRDQGDFFTDFRSPGLPKEMVFRRNPDKDRYVADYREACLKLLPGAPLFQSPASPFCGVRQRYFNTVSRCTVELPPDGFQGRAGLAAVMEDRHYYSIGVAREGDSLLLKVHLKIGSIEEVQTETILPDSNTYEITLQIETDENFYYIGFVSHGRFICLKKAESRYLSSETAGGFTGVVIGLFAESDTGTTSPAIFRNFSSGKAHR